MTSVLEHESNLRVEWSGPADRLRPRIALIQGAGSSSGWRLLTFLVIIWVPFLVFSQVESRMLGPTEASPTPGDSLGPAGAEANAPLRSGCVTPGKSKG